MTRSTEAFPKLLKPAVPIFYIRVQRCASLYDMVKGITYWEAKSIGVKEFQVTSIEYAPFGWEKT